MDEGFRRVRSWRGRKFVFFHYGTFEVIGGSAVWDGCGDYASLDVEPFDPRAAVMVQADRSWPAETWQLRRESR